MTRQSLDPGPVGRVADRLQSAAEELHRFATGLEPKSDRWLAALIDIELGFRRGRTALLGDRGEGDPAWDILLELAKGRLDGERRILSEICSSYGIPMSAGVRGVSQLIELDLVERSENSRRFVVRITDAGLAKLAASLSDGAKIAR